VCKQSAMLLQHKVYILYTHNRLRSKLALGKQQNKEGMMGSGKNIYSVGWDCDLEFMAHKWTKSCTSLFMPSTSSLSGTQLVKGFDTTFHGRNITQHIDHAMRSWWTEYKRHGNVDYKNRYFSRQLYYGWANMAKGKLTRIGCSYSTCDGKRKALFSCIYDEKAQYENQQIYEPGKPCQADDDCSTYPHSKCLGSLGLCQKPYREAGLKTNNMCPQLNTTLTDESRVLALDQHNFYRSRLARGLEFNGETNSTQEGASGLMKMEYDCNLEWYAQIWADNCIFEHSDRKERPNQGQNLYMTSFTNVARNSMLHTAIELWWKELEEYGIPADGMLTKDVWTRKGNFIGHFTQMAWSDSVRLGCAVARCPQMGLVVCHYSPAGNIKGRHIYKLGSSCQQDVDCPHGSSCIEKEGLCSGPHYLEPHLVRNN
ncbi:hypothetical protein Angca_005461, partial [Angiostrongylus cantonensis]